MTSDVRTDAHRGSRTVPRLAGGAVLFAGLPALLGLADLFGATATATAARFCDGCGASVA